MREEDMRGLIPVRARSLRLSVLSAMSVLGLMMMMLAACDQLGGSLVISPTESLGLEEGGTPTPSPVGVPANTPAPSPTVSYVAYQHPTGVFALNVPVSWRAVDETTVERILVNIEPPLGYGSRIMVDITHEGALTPDEVEQIIEGYLRLRYADDPAYTEINRTRLPDGRLQVTYLYDDRAGVTGRETVYLQQVGPYFSALRVFLTDDEALTFGSVVEAMVAGYVVDPLAGWSGQASGLGADELRLLNTMTWQRENGVIVVQGEVYNDTESAVEEVIVEAAACNPDGVVLAEMSAQVPNRVLPPGGFAPFSLAFEGVPDFASTCVMRANGSPAGTPAPDQANLQLERTANFNEKGQLVVQGTLTNVGEWVAIDIQVIIAVYDKDNRVIGVGVVSPDDLRLESGQSGAFDYTFKELGGEADHFVTWVQAEAE
jgi:hypothetical protein